MKTRYSNKDRVLLILFFSVFPLMLFSQETNTCAENLKTAQALFDKGRIEQVPDMLRECMKSGFKREEQLAAYKLLIQSYLFEDKLELADSTMLEFLKRNPEYQLSPTDHSTFIYLYNSFRVRPVVQVAFHLGTNFPFLTFIDPVTLSSEPGINKYSSDVNLFASFEAKFQLNKKLELNVEGGYSQLSFTNVEKFLGFGEIIYIERQSRLEIPVSATYNFTNFGKFTLYGRAGLGVAFNISTSAKTSFKPTDVNNFESHTGADLNRLDSRIMMDFIAQTGAGIKFKTPGGYISLEIRSNFGLINQVVRGGNSAETLRWDYYYADDNFNMNNLNINVGYTQIFYKPSKRN